jgi:hypothetical protein
MRMLSSTAGAAPDRHRSVVRRAPAGPRRPTEVLHFEPTEFHRRFSGAIPPALRIFPGDTVKTRTVDAGRRGLERRAQEQRREPGDRAVLRRRRAAG